MVIIMVALIMALLSVDLGVPTECKSVIGEGACHEGNNCAVTISSEVEAN